MRACVQFKQEKMSGLAWLVCGALLFVAVYSLFCCCGQFSDNITVAVARRHHGRVRTIGVNRSFAARGEQGPTVEENPNRKQGPTVLQLDGALTKIVHEGGSVVGLAQSDLGGVNLTGQEPVKCQLTDGELTIQDRHSSAHAMSISISRVVQISSSSNSRGQRTRRLVVDGEEVDLDELRQFKRQQQRALADPDREYSTQWRIVGTANVRRATVHGDGSLVLDDNVLAQRSKLDVSGMLPYRHSLRIAIYYYSGSGNVCLSKARAFESLAATVSGTGTIDLGGSQADSVTAHVSGTGDVLNFHATHTGEFDVSGTGDIRGTVAHQCEVDRHVSGTGHIHIRRI